MAVGNYRECVFSEGADAPPLPRIIEDAATLTHERYPLWRSEPDRKDLGPAEFTCPGIHGMDARAIAHQD